MTHTLTREERGYILGSTTTKEYNPTRSGFGPRHTLESSEIQETRHSRTRRSHNDSLHPAPKANETMNTSGHNNRTPLNTGDKMQPFETQINQPQDMRSDWDVEMMDVEITDPDPEMSDAEFAYHADKGDDWVGSSQQNNVDESNVDQHNQHTSSNHQRLTQLSNTPTTVAVSPDVTAALKRKPQSIVETKPGIKPSI
jgi:hypothetical protein